MTAKELLEVASRSWEVFHIVVQEAYSAAGQKWKELLGERAIFVEDHTKLAEVIVSTIQVIEGHDAQKVVDSWSGDTSLVVAGAIKGLTTKDAGAGVRL